MNACPFCGSHNIDFRHFSKEHWVVECLQCHAFGSDSKAKIGAENKWNRRAQGACAECEKNRRKLITAIQHIDEVDKPWREENFRLHDIIEEAKKLLVDVANFVDNFQRQASRTALTDVWERIKMLGNKLSENHTSSMMANVPVGLTGKPKQAMIDYVNALIAKQAKQ